MKMKNYKLCKGIGTFILLGSLLGINSAYADENIIKNKLRNLIPVEKIDSIKLSVINGLYEVTIGSNILYASEDGKYVIQGHLLDVTTQQDLTKLKLTTLRKQAIARLGQNKMIVFKAINNKYRVSIFTDIDCGYCRKLHAQIAQYLAEGITVQYLFYPRTGKGSESYNKAVSVWCAADQKAALTAAKKGKNPTPKTCNHPVDEHIQLAIDFDIRGTPMIVTENGFIFPGYVSAKRLAEELASQQPRHY